LHQDQIGTTIWSVATNLNLKEKQLSNPKILKVGHAFVKGKFANDKPKKDSIWGLMQTDEHVIKFFGRRGGSIRFKQEPISELAAALTLYQQKLDGTDAKKLKHDDLDDAKQAELLGADFAAKLIEKYTSALTEGNIDTRIAKVQEDDDAGEATEKPAKAPKAPKTPKASKTAAEKPQQAVETPTDTAQAETSTFAPVVQTPGAPFHWPYPASTVTKAAE
jgi:hypothetical protein